MRSVQGRLIIFCGVYLLQFTLKCMSPLLMFLIVEYVDFERNVRGRFNK
jgi:hypothetical protein